jgi:hypothetical protein
MVDGGVVVHGRFPSRAVDGTARAGGASTARAWRRAADGGGASAGTWTVRLWPAGSGEATRSKPSSILWQRPQNQVAGPRSPSRTTSASRISPCLCRDQARSQSVGRAAGGRFPSSRARRSRCRSNTISPPKSRFGQAPAVAAAGRRASSAIRRRGLDEEVRLAHDAGRARDVRTTDRSACPSGASGPHPSMNGSAVRGSRRRLIGMTVGVNMRCSPRADPAPASWPASGRGPRGVRVRRRGWWGAASASKLPSGCWWMR